MSMFNRGERERAERSDKKIRVSPSISKSLNEKLDRLAVACGITKTSLAAFIIEANLNNENAVNSIQEHFKDNSRFRIIPTAINKNEIKYIFANKVEKGK